MTDNSIRLQALKTSYLTCQRCALATSRQRVLFGRGAPGASVLIVGERVGGIDEEVGEPFAGPAGDLLRRILAAPNVEIPYQEVYLTNLVLCRTPSERSPRAGEIRACQERLMQEVVLVGAPLIVLLGRLPLRYCLGCKGNLEERRGWHSWGPCGASRTAYVTFNPASILHGDVHDSRRKRWLIYEDWQAIAQAYRTLPRHSA